MKALLTTCGAALLAGSLVSAAAADEAAVLDTYADIALAGYEDSLMTAQLLHDALEGLVTDPTESNLAKARTAWLTAREPYQQTEAYRFGNEIVDDWEGRVNAWPLDEGMIDYVNTSYGDGSGENALYTVNVIANPKITVGGETIDASAITPALLSDTLHEAEEVEANVATGYHAIEFLLWGQDLNGTGPGAGNRPATDFNTSNCTGGNCQRRIDYLMAASELMISDLEEMVANWQEGGDAREALQDGGLSRILTGLGSLSYGELAGERMKLGLLLHDPEEEHDCFADNTHNSHYYDIKGMVNVYTGTYKRVDGSQVMGASLHELLAETDPALAQELHGQLLATLKAAETMVARAERIESYDQMIGAGNPEGNAVVQAVIDGLVEQTRSIERAVAALNIEEIEFEGSDSLDNPSAVFQ